jgi:hypothetical protein
MIRLLGGNQSIDDFENATISKPIRKFTDIIVHPLQPQSSKSGEIADKVLSGFTTQTSNSPTPSIVPKQRLTVLTPARNFVPTSPSF